MEKQRSPIRIVEELGDTRALILNNDFPFLTDTLTEKLLLQGCEVDRAPVFLKRYDYIISLGISKQLKNALKKNPDVFPFQKLIKNGGKAVVVVSSGQDLPKKKLGIATLVLDSTQTFAAGTLATKILKKLFTGSPISVKEPPKKYSELDEDEDGEKKPTKKQSKMKLRLFLVISILVLFFSPLFLFLAGTVSGAYWLSKSVDQNSSIEKRKSYIKYAAIRTDITKTTASLLHSLIFPFSEQTAKSIEAVGDVAHNASQSAQEAITIEEMLKEDALQIFKKQKTDSFEKHIPLYQDKLTAIDKYLADAADASTKLSFIQKIPIAKQYYPHTPKIEEVRRTVNESREALTLVPGVLAFNGEKNYLLLFQNNFELRPTGGFIGSFALMTIKNGAITAIKVEKI